MKVRNLHGGCKMLVWTPKTGSATSEALRRRLIDDASRAPSTVWARLELDGSLPGSKATGTSEP